MSFSPQNLNTLLSTKLARKVPEVTIFFWIVKLFTTAVGESTSDYLVHTISPIIAVCLGATAFTIAIILQFWIKKYNAWIYWLAVTMVAIFGTMAADVIHIGFGVPYYQSTIFFALLLVIVFTLWYRTEHTLSIHSIYTPRREIFYWATVVTTFALGTAAGDMTAATFGLGYLISGILFGMLFILPGLGYYTLKLHDVFVFWFAYIMTRPLGASFADWFGRSPDLGGIGFGTGRISIILAVIIILFVAFLARTRIDVKKE